MAARAKIRLRLPLEVFAEVRRRVSPRLAVGCRFLADECIAGGSDVSDAVVFGAAFARAGMDFLSTSRGGKFEVEFARRADEQKIHAPARAKAAPKTAASLTSLPPAMHSSARKRRPKRKARLTQQRISGEHFKRQPQPVLARAAIAIVARVGAREKAEAIV